MKKFFISLGLAAAGTAGVQAAAYAPNLAPMEASKWWSVSGTLRGFYDDNYTTAPAGSTKKGSFGFEVSPQLEVNVPLQQTEFGLRYTYGLYYYQEREDLGQNPIDQSHQLDLWMDHAFSERWQAKVQDSFVMAQEPELLANGGNTTVPQRVEGNNIANTGNINVSTEWSQMFSTSVGYNNSFYDFQNSGGDAANPSLAGLLNRIEQTANIDFQYHVSELTMAFVGYQFGAVTYIGNEQIAASPFPPGYYVSSTRDNYSHYGYVGLQHTFSDNFNVSAKGGVQYTKDYNDPFGTTSLSPYADIEATYTYAPGSYMQMGFTQSRNATDIVSPDASGHITQDQESSVIYASINHPLTPKLQASLIGHWQYSVYQDGLYNNQSEIYYDLGLNMSYAFTQHFSADAGYDFDYVDTSVGGQRYTRNRGYLGVSAAF